MYRIPPPDSILDRWGSEQYPYRETAHFSSALYPVTTGDSVREYVHAHFWRKYDFAPESEAVSNVGGYAQETEWEPFVASTDALNADSLCFLSIASFYGGEYPFDDDALEGLLPGLLS